MSNHTPGPWEAEHLEKAGYWAVEAQIPGLKRSGPVADTLNQDHCIDPEEERANAHLIAAAPLLLDACEAALSYFDRQGEGPAMTSLQMFETLKNAIAKARGQ
jgi:hypothetical protein